MYQIRTDQRAALEGFVADEILCEPPEGRTMGGAWLDRRLRGGKSRQVAGWDASELDQHDSPLDFVRVLLEVVESPGAHHLRVEWREVDAEGRQNTQSNVYKRKKLFEIKREQVQKTDRTNDAGAALRGMGTALAQNADRAMDAQQRSTDAAARAQSDYMDRMLSMQARHLDRLDEEQASVVDLMDERAELRAEVAVAELRLELAQVTASQNVVLQSIQGALQVLQPVVAVVTQRLVGGPSPQALPTAEHPRPSVEELEQTIAAQAALIAQLQGVPAEQRVPGPADTP